MLLFLFLLLLPRELSFKRIDPLKKDSIKNDNQVYIWNLTSKELEFTLNSTNGKVVSLLKLENNILACGYDNGLVRLWNLTNRKVNRTFFHENSGLIQLSRLEEFSDLLAVDTFHSVVIWNITSGQKKFIFQQNNFYIFFLCVKVIF